MRSSAVDRAAGAQNVKGRLRAASAVRGPTPLLIIGGVAVTSRQRAVLTGVVALTKLRAESRWSREAGPWARRLLARASRNCLRGRNGKALAAPNGRYSDEPSMLSFASRRTASLGAVFGARERAATSTLATRRSRSNSASRWRRTGLWKEARLPLGEGRRARSRPTPRPGTTSRSRTSTKEVRQGARRPMRKAARARSEEPADPAELRSLQRNQ